MAEANIYDGIRSAPDSSLAALLSDLTDLALAQDAASELQVMCEQLARDHPGTAIERTLEHLTATGRKSAADLLISRAVH